MDPFQGLPSLIQTEIFEHLETESSIMQLIQASPSMLRHFLAYKKSILQSILNRLLKGDTSGHLLRDALGIVYVSDIITAKAYHHGNLWQTRELPDPIGLADLQTLFRLFSRVIIMIEDHANKATSIYPPRNYLGLPDLVLDNEAEFKGQRLGTKKVRLSFLSPAERYRFLRAFLRHELFCRVYHPKYWHFTELDDPEDLWARYGTSESPSLNDLSSVHKYYKSVYGALFAHLQDSWLPDIPDQSATKAIEKRTKDNDGGNRVKPTSQDHGLLFPDNLFFDAGGYLEDLEYHCAGKQSELPFFGLDLLIQLVTCTCGRSRYYGPPIVHKRFFARYGIDQAEEVGIVGLAGTIDRGDWAYTSGTELRLAMFNILYEQRAAYSSNRPWKKQEFAWTLAEKVNGDCIVIDFRNFREFVIRLPPGGVR